jgi:predicted secreted protein
MTIQKRNVIVILVFILLGNLCAEATGKLDTMGRKVMLDIYSNGKQVELKVGDEINIELVGAGGTGYWWYFDKLDHNLFELVDEETRVAGKGEKEMTGRPVIGTWKLRAKKAGRSIIKMKYYRAWEKSSKAINQFEVSVDIRP